MLNKSLTILIGLLLCVSLSASRAFAGDLQLNYDKQNNSIALTNTLAATVYVLYLEGSEEERIPVHLQIAAGKKVVVPLNELSLPAQLLGAACTFTGEPPAGMKRGTDGKFHLSVDPA